MDMEMQGVKKCVILTGMSGAGKSTALKILEDQGMFAIDNIPPALLSQLMALLEKHRAAVRNGVAAVVDVRGDALLDDFSSALSALKTQIPEVRVLFLDASDDSLLTRFESTRRRHPFHDEGTFLDGITRERTRLNPILELSDIVLDTTELSLAAIRKKLLGSLSGPVIQDHLIFTSFGFKYGVPADCDFLFDVRFLSNPFYIPDLQPLSGRDKEVQNYIWSSEGAGKFWEGLISFLEHIIPLYFAAGKSHLHIALGCTGGRHRSVTVAERLSVHFGSFGGLCSLRHRDVAKDQGG